MGSGGRGTYYEWCVEELREELRCGTERVLVDFANLLGLIEADDDFVRQDVGEKSVQV